MREFFRGSERKDKCYFRIAVRFAIPLAMLVWGIYVQRGVHALRNNSGEISAETDFEAKADTHPTFL
ncbi:MAG: hypothetical protein QM813_27420 [Verrucomicrobiota bacterium]